MIGIIISCLIGALISAGVVYAILTPQIKQREFEDQQIREKNINARVETEALDQRYKYLRTQYDDVQKSYIKLRDQLAEESKKAGEDAKQRYEEATAVYSEKLKLWLAEEEKKYKRAAEEYQQEYLSILSDSAKSFEEDSFQKRQILSNLNQQIQNETSIAQAAIEANKRASEMEQKGNFYRLNLSPEDLDEISELKKCVKHLRDPEPLNKVIWKVYYEKAYTDLVGRVVGSGIHCGIYKITNLKTGMCYVGQAVNISDRWKQHIKRGIGADTPTRNKLYPAMIENGVENFSFELIEECPREKLNEREDYWQEFFKAKEFGYSIK